MGIRHIKPTTPGQRFKTVNDFTAITSSTPEKSLLAGKKRSGGRNNSGRMTMRYIGGGHKQSYRIVDFKRTKDSVPAIVNSIQYDPNRTAFIALLFYKDGEKSYIIAPANLKVGDKVVSGSTATPDLGNVLQIKDIPLGTDISCIEMKPGKGAALARSAGSYAKLVAKDKDYAVLKLPSGESRMILLECRAMIGQVSNSDHQLILSGKAGRSRWLGRRPRTRGVAMNPVDHPMGGGEGRSSGGHPRSRNGIPSKGYKTRNKKKHSEKYILSRKK